MSDLISIERLSKLHPSIRSDAVRAYREAVRLTPQNVHPVVVQTLRTFEEQDLLYQKGRTRPGPIVTNAKAGSSYHNYGLALDFCLDVKGKLIWTVNKDWMTVVECFKELGFSWGGDWTGGFKDYPHLEKHFGFHWRDLLALHNEKKVDEGGYIVLPHNVV
jgi:peptidoglycan L-alanyl-D-glutamate endopeptidase CwlK